MWQALRPETLMLICWLMAVPSDPSTDIPPYTQPRNPPDTVALRQKIAAIQQSKGMEGALLTAYVLPLEGKAPIFNFQGETSMATASTLKAITTATGLLLLGSDFTFQTRLEYDGNITENGTLQGNLYIRGGGDPTLGKDRLADLFMEWVAAVKNAGIRRIEGLVVGDARFFDHQLTPGTWAWEDIGNYYGAGASGLSINENLYRLFFKTGFREGDKTTVMGTEPKIPGLEFTNEIRTGKPGSGDNGYIYGVPYTYQRYLRGTLPPNYLSFMIKGAIPDPAYFTAYELSRQLEAAGVPISEGGITFRLMNVPTRPPYTEIWRGTSPPLSEIVERTNQRSVNLYAEAILRMLGKSMKEKGTTEAGTEVIKEFWEAEGIDMEGCFFADGSGLSRYNAVPAKTMAEILQHTFRKDPSGAFLASLPVAGESGTLKNMCRGRVSAGRIHAKSGYINRVRAYTGLAETLKGEKLVFAIMVNNYEKPYAQLTRDFEELMDLLVNL